MPGKKKVSYPEEQEEEMCIDITTTITVYTEAQQDLFSKFHKDLAELKLKECPWIEKYEPFKSKAWRK